MPAELHPTPIPGAFELHTQPFADHRGIAQVNLSRTEVVGTIRGLHLQRDPFSEAKLVRCLRGRVWDVAVDLRRESATYGHWHAVELSPEQSNALLIPEGCAHGFQVLAPASELLYLHSGAWEPDAATGRADSKCVTSLLAAAATMG